jgi:hypothetical protein
MREKRFTKNTATMIPRKVPKTRASPNATAMMPSASNARNGTRTTFEVRTRM